MVDQERVQTRIAPTLQLTQFVANIPHLTCVLLFVKDVVHQQVPSRATAGAGVPARLLQVVLRQVVEHIQRLVERLLQLLNHGRYSSVAPVPMEPPLPFSGPYQEPM